MKEDNKVKKTVTRAPKKAVKTKEVKTSKVDAKESKETLLEAKKPVKKQSTRRIVKKQKEEIEIVKKSVEFSLLEVIVIVLITGLVVSVASGLIVYNNYDKINVTNTINPAELDEFYENYNKIINNYVEEVDKQELLDAAISGMYNYLGDEYSMYMSKDDTDDLEEQLTGEYTGVGIEITTVVEDDNQYVQIHRVFKDSPAEAAGLKTGDIIKAVDGEEMKDANQVSNTIKKGNKESYEITYVRDGKENTLILTRKKVLINSVSSEVYDNVGYIKIDTFSATTKTQLLNILDNFDKKVTSLVIDLRDNTGGYLDTAYSVSDLFLEKGKIVYQLKDRNGNITSYKAQDGVYRKFNKIVVLINENSASASEILTLALKESAGATVVGNRSYGKGTVQETGTLNSGSMIKYTISYWLSPKGNSINKLGIEPDIKVTEVEKQLDEALKAAK